MSERMREIKRLWRRVRELEYRVTSYGDLGAQGELDALVSRLKALRAYTRDQEQVVGQGRGGLRLVA